MRSDRLPARVGEVLGAVGRRLGLDDAGAAAAVWSRWDAIVGATMAARSAPTSLRRGVLRVVVPSPAWATEIGYLAGDVRRAVNDSLGREVVREVRVYVGKVPERRPAAPRRCDADGSGTAVDDPLEALRRARAAATRRRTPGAGSGRSPRRSC